MFSNCVPDTLRHCSECTEYFKFSVDTCYLPDAKQTANSRQFTALPLDNCAPFNVSHLCKARFLAVALIKSRCHIKMSMGQELNVAASKLSLLSKLILFREGRVTFWR